MSNPIRELLGEANFRRFWIAQILMFGVNGTVRFAFVWLMVTLTDWSAAEGLIGIAYGLPALFVSLPAGAWSDRVDRRRFFLFWAGLSALAFAVFAVVVAADLATPRLAGVAAFVIGTLLVILSPNLNAIVPLLVPPERLINAAALQNGGGQAAGFLGLALGGLLIEWVGNPGSFAMMSVVCVIAVVLMLRVTIPATVPAATSTATSSATATATSTATSTGAEASTGQGNAKSTIRSEVMAGMRSGLGSEPSRTLLVLALILGSSFSVMQIAMPRVVEEDFARDSGAAGLLLGTFGLGMLVSSLWVARNQHGLQHGWNIARFIGIGLGMGQFLLSLAPGYWTAMVVMVAWGINAGVAIASHRTLLQQSTEPQMMGRVMGIMILGFAGGLPFGALTQAVLSPAIGPIMTMRVVGLVTMAITIPLTWRRVIRTA
ncbi:MAG: MFS transporter [Actinomycetota bacterium]